MAQRALEITLVRQEIDSQIAMVQQAQQADSPAWQALKAADNIVDNPGPFSDVESCPNPSSLAKAQFLGIDTATRQVTRYPADSSTYFSHAPVYSRVDLQGAATGNVPHTYGLWMMLARAEEQAGTNIAYDLHVRACWDSMGTNRPMTIGTVVRLYAIN